MSENFVMSGNLVELAEFKTYKLGTFLISVLDEWDLNHRFITTEEGQKSCESIIGFPIVAKLVTDDDGNPVDFRGHEVYQEQLIIVKNIDNHRQMLSYILNNRNTPHIV